MSSTIFSSNTSQQKWAEKLNDDFIVYVENPPSIFQVPKSISDTNPEAYAPQEIGIGPYHHFRRDLDHMESRKFAAIKTFLKPEQFHNFKSLVVDKVRAMEPSIRSCYDKYLDLDSDALAWAMAIDGVYLIHLLTEASPDASKIARDVLMMENQFPIIVLNEIRKVLCAQASGNSTHALLMQEARGRGNKDISDLPEVEESDDDCTESDDASFQEYLDKLASLQQQQEASGSCNMHDPWSRKFAAIKTFLKPEQLQNFKSLVVDRVRALEPSIRSCYEKYLDLDGDTLAWAMAIDGVYLIHLFKEASPDASKIEWYVQDQFPCIVLNEIWEALLQPQLVEVKEEEYGESGDIPNVERFDESEVRREDLFSEMSFCRLHSPLNIELDAPQNSPHILDLMYRLLVIKLSHEQHRKFANAMLRSAAIVSAGGELKEVAGVAAELTGLNSLKFIANLPLEEFFGLFGNANSSTDSSIEEIQIPSVSQLHRVSRIQFEKSTSGRAVRYDGKTRKLYLPVMRLNTESEVILRNLVAYELALASNDNVVSGYVDLMCGLIDTAEDVDLLKEKGIIDTILPSEEVAKVFNGINKSSGMVDGLEVVTQKLNEAYDGTFRIRCFRFVKNHLIPSENCIKLVLGILLVLLLTFQAFCQVYGCSAHWFGVTSFASI